MTSHERYNQGTANSESGNSDEKVITDTFSALFAGFANNHRAVNDVLAMGSPFEGLERDRQVYDEIAEFIQEKDPVLQSVERGEAPREGGVYMLANTYEMQGITYQPRIQFVLSDNKQELHLIIHHPATPDETMRFVLMPKSQAESVDFKLARNGECQSRELPVDFLTGSGRYPVEHPHGDATEIHYPPSRRPSEEFQMFSGVFEQEKLASVIEPPAAAASLAFQEATVAAANVTDFLSHVRDNNVTDRITAVFEGIGQNVASMEMKLGALLPVLTEQVESTMSLVGTVCVATGAVVAICALFYALSAAMKANEQFQKARASDRIARQTSMLKTVGAMLIAAGIGYVGYRTAGLLLLQYETWLTVQVSMAHGEGAVQQAFHEAAQILGHLPPPPAHVNEGEGRRFSGIGRRLDNGIDLTPDELAEPNEHLEGKQERVLKEQYGMREQFQNASDTSASLMALLVAVTKTIHDPKIDGWKCFQDLMKDSKNFKVLISSTEAIIDLIPEQIRLTVYEKFGFGAPGDITPAQKELISECYFLHNYMMKHQNHTAGNKKLWMEAFSKLSAMLGNPEIMGPQKSSFARTLSSHIHTLMSGQVQRITEIPDNKGFRLRTTGVWLSGEQGTGKSKFITHLATRFGARFPVDRRCHIWSSADAYDSGYKGQWGLDIDDVGSNIPVLQKKAFFQGMLTMLSTKPCQMNMAFDKGMAFESHAVFLSSNETPDHILAMAGGGNCLTNPEAVKRRFTGDHGIMAEVWVPPEFKHINHENKNVPNAKMIEKSADEHPNEFRWLRFTVEGEVLTATDFMNRFANCYSAAMLRYKNDSEARGVDMGPDLLVGALNDVADYCNIQYTGEQFQMHSRTDIKRMVNGEPLRQRRGGSLVAGMRPRMQNPEGKQAVPQPVTTVLNPVMQAMLRRRTADYITVETVDKNATLGKVMKLGYLRIGKNQQFTPAQQQVALQEMERSIPVIFGNVELPGPEPTPDEKDEPGHVLANAPYKRVLPGSVAMSIADAEQLCEKWQVEVKRHGDDEKEPEGPRFDLVEAMDGFLFFVPDTKKTVVVLNLDQKMMDYLIAYTGEISEAACMTIGLGVDGQGLTREEMKQWVDDEARAIVQEQEVAALPPQRFSFDWFKAKAAACWKSLTDSIEALMRKISAIDWLKLGKILGATLGITALAVKGWEVYKDWTRKDPPEQEQSRDVERESDTKHGPYRAPARHGPRRQQGQAYQMLVVPEEPFLAQLARNTAIFCPNPTFDERNSGTAMFLVGKRMMLNSHYLNGKKFPCEVSYTVQGIEFNATMKEEDIHWLRNDAGKKTDICVWRVPHDQGRVPSDFPKITQHFPKHSELKRKYYTSEEGGETVYLLTPGARHSRNMVRSAVRTAGKFSSLKNNDHEVLQMDETFEYTSDKGFVKGDCGSVLTDGRQILGVHLCGKGLTDDHYPIGVSQVVTKEEINLYFTKFQMRNDELDDSALDYLPEGSRRGEDSDMWGMPQTGDFLVEASIRVGNKTPTETKYRRTGLAEHGSKWAASCKKVPAVLSPSDPRYTGTATTASQFMADQLGRYAKIPPALDPALLKACMSKLTHAIPKSKLAPEHQGVWSLHHALNPRLIGSVLKPLPLGTSAGALHDGPGKRRYILFDEKSQQYFATPKLEEEVKLALDLIAEGKNPLFLFADFPKDELLPEPKVTQMPGYPPPKFCRTVSASPVDLSLITKMAFGAFADAFQRENFNWGHMVGVDVMSQDWDTMIKRLLRVSPVGFDGDFKNFDSTMGPQFMRSFYEHVDEWYKRNGIWSEADSRLRWVCVYNVMFSKHLVGHTIVRLLFGNKSGQWMTTPKNCFYSKFLIMYAFVMLSRDDRDAGTRRYSLEGFDRLVFSYVLGDDNINAVSPLIPWFNAQSVAEVLSKVGVTYTPATKSGQLSSDLRSLFELEFLSNTTVIDDFIPGMSFYPFIKTDSLSKCVAWVKKSAQLSHCESTDTNIQQSLRRVFLSGRERFEDFRQDTVSAFEAMVPDSGVSFHTWDELLFEFSPLNAQYFEQFHGITVSTTKNNIGAVQGGGVEMNQENKFETKTDVHAKAGNDSPNIPVSLASVLRQPSPPGSSGERVDFLPTWAITNTLEGANMTTANTGDDMSLKALTQPGFRTSVQWQVGQDTGTILWQAPIMPNSVLYTENFSLSSTTLPTALASVSSLYAAWRGGIQFGFNGISASVHTGRLGVAVNYGTGPPPVTLADLTSQRYTVFEVSGENKKAVIEVPYVATTRLKEIYVGQHLDNCSTGYISLFVMNSLRAPVSCSNVIEINISEGAGPDMEFFLPFAVNNTVRYIFEDSPSQPEDEEFHQVDMKEQFQMMATGIPQVESVRSGFESPIVMHSQGDVSAPFKDPIMATPQTLTILLRRSIPVSVNNDAGVEFNKWFTTGSLFGQGKNTWQMYSGVDKLSKYFRVWGGPFNVLAYSKAQPVAMAYYPLVAEEPTNRGIFTQGDPTGSFTNFAQAFSFAPSGVAYAGGVVPFTSIQHCCLIPHFLSEVGTQSNTGVVQYETGTSSSPVTVTFSAGDGFRFGVRFAIPLMRAGNSNVTPDNWPEPVDVKERYQMNSVDDMPKLSPSPLTLMERFQMNSGDAVIGGEEKVGVVLTDSSELTPVEVQATVPGTSDTKIMGQPQLNFLDFLRRDQWVANFDWAITNPKGLILYDRPVPTGLLLNTALRAYSAFRQHKLDAYVTVKVQATGWHSGRLVAMTTPMTAPVESKRTFFGVGSAYPTLEYRRNQTFAEHVFIDAAASSSVTLRIPFRYFKSYLENGEDFAQFYIAVFNQLRVGEGGDATASCTVYVRFEAADLRVINPL